MRNRMMWVWRCGQATGLAGTHFRPALTLIPMITCRTPPVAEIALIWHMAFGEPPVLKAEAELLLAVLEQHFPDVLAIVMGTPEGAEASW
jgi:hypothetical protein